MRLPPRSRRIASTLCPAQGGYILIILILFVALLAIALTALAPLLTQQIKRDREEELIHRGTQYSRAIKHYMKKFNRYPTRIEDLENTNEVRFLRKRYKDPLTGKDFKLLHQGEVQMSGGPGLAGATSAATLAAGAAALAGGATPFGGSGAFGGNSGSSFGGNSGGAFGGGNSGFGGNSGSSFGGNSGGAFGGGNSSFGGNSGSTFGGNSGGAFGGNTPTPPVGANPAQDNGSDAAPNQGQPQGPGFGQPVQNLPGGNGQNPAGNQVFGGGPIVGVESVSKDKSIRIFSKKEHYNEWQFIYDPSTDRGGLITTPNQPPVQGASPSLNGTPGAPGAPGAQGAQGGPASPFGFGGNQQNPGFGGGQNSFGGMNPQQPPPPQPQAPQ